MLVHGSWGGAIEIEYLVTLPVARIEVDEAVLLPSLGVGLGLSPDLVIQRQDTQPDHREQRGQDANQVETETEKDTTLLHPWRRTLSCTLKKIPGYDGVEGATPRCVVVVPISRDG